MFWNKEGPFAGWVCITNLTVMDGATAQQVRAITSRPEGADFEMEHLGTLNDAHEGMKFIHLSMSALSDAWTDGSMYKIDPLMAGVFVAGAICKVNNSSEARE